MVSASCDASAQGMATAGPANFDGVFAGGIDDVVGGQDEISRQSDARSGWATARLDAHGPRARGLDRVGELVRNSSEIRHVPTLGTQRRVAILLAGRRMA